MTIPSPIIPSRHVAGSRTPAAKPVVFIVDDDVSFRGFLKSLVESAAHMRATHGICDERGDVVTASLLDGWIDEAENRAWFLFEATRKGEEPGR